MTLRHGPMPNLDMPAMTMVFKVADPKMLDGLKEGDKVKFAADKVNGAYHRDGHRGCEVRPRERCTQDCGHARNVNSCPAVHSSERARERFSLVG